MRAVDTEKHEVFAALAKFAKDNGRNPTLRELGAQLERSHEHIRRCMIELEKDGCVKRRMCTPRSGKIIAWSKEAEALAA